MQPILNFFGSLLDKFLLHIPQEQQDAFKGELLVAGSVLAEAAARGAAQGLKKDTSDAG